MPLYPPRRDTTKKREQLLKREQELRHAIHSEFPKEKLIGAAENLRAAQLSLFKATLYWVRYAALVGPVDQAPVEKIERDTKTWVAKAVDEILHEHGAV